MLNDYYSVRGWDRDGVPLPQTLADLGLQLAGRSRSDSMGCCAGAWRAVPRISRPTSCRLWHFCAWRRSRPGDTFWTSCWTPDQGLLTGTIILVNGENIRLKQGLETRVGAGTRSIFSLPAGGGREGRRPFNSGSSFLPLGPACFC